VAGILEGEGSFGLTNNGRSPAMWLGMSDSDVIERVRAIVDRSMSIKISHDKRKEGYKDSFRIFLNGDRAIGWMMTIYPLMSIRRKSKIRECLEAWKSVKLDNSQIRIMGPRRRLIESYVKLGYTYDEAYKKLGEIENVS
jgi:hypothetical protein